VLTKKKKKHKVIESRNFSPENVAIFKEALGALTWDTTFQQDNVNNSFENFSNDFMLLFNLHFPLIKKKFNKNFHKINDFMTAGLLVSRRNKINLHKKQLWIPLSRILTSAQKIQIFIF